MFWNIINDECLAAQVECIAWEEKTCTTTSSKERIKYNKNILLLLLLSLKQLLWLCYKISNNKLRKVMLKSAQQDAKRA